MVATGGSAGRQATVGPHNSRDELVSVGRAESHLYAAVVRGQTNGTVAHELHCLHQDWEHRWADHYE
jgi:hypothetical protein